MRQIDSFFSRYVFCVQDLARNEVTIRCAVSCSRLTLLVPPVSARDSHGRARVVSWGGLLFFVFFQKGLSRCQLSNRSVLHVIHIYIVNTYQSTVVVGRNK